MITDKITKENAAKLIGSRRPLKTDATRVLGYSRIIDTEEYAVYERPVKADMIVAAYGDIAVKRRGDRLFYIPNARVPFIKYRIDLCEKDFPGLIHGSHFMQCLLLPYLRVVRKDTYVKDVRLCIFTDKGQVFHNKPSRDKNYDGFSKSEDIIRFEESVIWDLPGRKHPSNRIDGDECECYFPGLPDYCYTYSPCINTDLAYKDPYGNGGFGKSIEVYEKGERKTCTRFYRYARTLQSNALRFIGTGFRNDKMNLIGTYCSNVEEGVRVCFFASSDGGRQWYCKYEFSDTGEYSFQQGHSNAWGTNFGNRIKLQDDVNCADYDIAVNKRTICLPEKLDGSTKTSFKWTESGRVKLIKAEETAKVYTERPHGLKTGNIVALLVHGSKPETVNWMVSDKLDENGNTGGFQFKVRVVDDCCFEIYELVSSASPTLPCRHIHHINTLKDGWIIGTGEIYPNGWLLYVQQKMADTYSVVDAREELMIRRINTEEGSVQRTMGLMLSDSPDNDIVFASDHDTLARNEIDAGNLGGVSRSSIGVFIGKLRNIDDRNAFECVYDASEPCYYFQKLDDMLAFTGQRGELAVCTDPNMRLWHQEHLGSTLMYYYGFFHQFQVFNDYILLRK